MQRNVKVKWSARTLLFVLRTVQSPLLTMDSASAVRYCMQESSKTDSSSSFADLWEKCFHLTSSQQQDTCANHRQ